MSRAERQTALTAAKLCCYSIDNALSDTRLTVKGSLQEVVSRDTFFFWLWGGRKPQTDNRTHGIDFAIKTAILKNISIYWNKGTFYEIPLSSQPILVYHHCQHLRNNFCKFRQRQKSFLQRPGPDYLNNPHQSQTYPSD